MRYLVLLLLVVCALPALAYNESVSAISYNPSRLGAYGYLKAVNKLVVKGGLNIVDDNAATLRLATVPGQRVTFQDAYGHVASNDNNCASVLVRSGVDASGDPLPEGGHVYCAGLNSISFILPLVDWEATGGGTRASAAGAIMQGPGGKVWGSLPSDLVSSSSINLQNEGTKISVRGGYLQAGNAYISGITRTAKSFSRLRLSAQTAFVEGNVLANQLGLGPYSLVNSTSTTRTLTFVDRVDDYGRKAQVLAATM